jgi:hypothetical protein
MPDQVEGVLQDRTNLANQLRFKQSALPGHRANTQEALLRRAIRELRNVVQIYQMAVALHPKEQVRH